jgi:hypothetical protein
MPAKDKNEELLELLKGLQSGQRRLEARCDSALGTAGQPPLTSKPAQNTDKRQRRILGFAKGVQADLSELSGVDSGITDGVDTGVPSRAPALPCRSRAVPPVAGTVRCV